MGDARQEQAPARTGKDAVASALLPDTPRLRFRTWSDADFPLAERLWGDPAVTRYLVRGTLDERAIRQRLERERASLERLGFQYWPMFLKETGAFVGCCGLKHTVYAGDAGSPELELGFHLVPEAWGRGLATEAATAAARLAFDLLRVPRLYAGHHPDNHASAAVLRKLGFEYVRDVLYEPTGLMHPLYRLEP